MAKITYPQQLPEDANSIKHVSIGQTRDGKDEFITPVTIWEVDKSTGKHVPAGGSTEVNAPRVKLDTEAQTALDGVKTELELVKAELELVKANQLSGDQKVQLSGTIPTTVFKNIEVAPGASVNTGWFDIVRSSINVGVYITSGTTSKFQVLATYGVAGFSGEYVGAQVVIPSTESVLAAGRRLGANHKQNLSNTCRLVLQNQGTQTITFAEVIVCQF